jgi:hypothetical protein
VLFQPSQRALDFMRCVLQEQRKCPRIHLPIRATVVFRDPDIHSQTAFLRDFNMLGAFLHCRQAPRIGQSAKLDFALLEKGAQIKAICEGLVVRVEEFEPAAFVGVAVEFSSYQLERPQKAEQTGQQFQNTPFIGWTVEMVERIFERSDHLLHFTNDGEHTA